MTQGVLFDRAALCGPGLDVVVRRGWLDAANADRDLRRVTDEVAWEQHHIVMFGRRSPVPRLDVWMADPDAVYSYSGITMAVHSWTPAVARLRDAVGRATGVTFNSVLLNRYRDGRDGVAWHADDEPELGVEPVIASISLGATRRFQLRRRNDPTERRSIELHHGDLMVMSGRTQAEWHHAVPRTARSVGERISLTFRVVQGVGTGSSAPTTR